MRLQDLVRFAWKALSDRKLRTSLTILGLVIGPATIVALVGATQGLSNGVSAQFSKTGATSIFLTPAQRGFSFTSADVSTLQSMPGVAAVVPFYLFSGTVAQGTQTTSVQIMAGDFSKLNQVFPGLQIEQGSEPAASNLGGAAIGSTLAYPNEPGIPNFTINNIVPVSFGGGNVGASFSGGGQVRFFSATGASSTSGSRSFIVTGVFAPFGQGFFINPDTGIFVPLATGQSILHSGKFTGIVVVASSPSTVDQVTSEISAHYGQQVRTISVSSILSTIQSVIGGIGTFLGAIGGISVLVAFIGIMTTMFTTVVERTKEIGILKALGYSSRNVLSIFLVEASVTGFAGGIIGAAAGAGLSFALVPLFSNGFSGGGGPRASATSTLTIVPAISPELILLAVGLATGVGMLAGLLPAWRASRLPPVDALRQE